MITFLKGILGNVGTYLALAGVLLAGYLKIKSVGRKEAEEEAREAVTDATEDLKKDADRIQKKVNEDSKKVDVNRDIYK